MLWISPFHLEEKLKEFAYAVIYEIMVETELFALRDAHVEYMTVYTAFSIIGLHQNKTKNKVEEATK